MLSRMAAPSAFRFAKLLRSQWYSPERLLTIQRAKLSPLIAHAYKNVPYYGQLFDRCGIKPEDIKDVGDLSKLPITTKADFLTHPGGDMTARSVNLAKCTTMRTSGSQGMPIDVVFRREDKAWWALLALRGWFANGYRFGQKILILNDSRFAAQGKRWFERVGIFRNNYASIYDDAERQLEIATSVQPDMIRGIASDVYRLAEAIREQGLTSTIAPKVVFTSAELMDNATRQFINETFGASLADFYGSIECGWIAWECPEHTGYHINNDCLIVEFIRDGLPVPAGEPGEVVVTNLHSYAMPFIRYSVGDVGIPGDAACPCGRGLPLMQTVEGRTIDCITLPDGRSISPYRLTCTVEQVPGIKRYQILQTSPEKLVVNMIPNEHFTEQVEPHIKAELRQLLGEEMVVQTVLTQELPKDHTGKFRIVMTTGDHPVESH